MGSRTPLQRRPVLGPLVYFFGSLFVGAEGYAFGYLLTDSIRGGLYCLAFMELLLGLYAVECARTAREGQL